MDGHPVALLDGKSRDGQVAAIVADERDIGAVEGGDKRQLFRLRHQRASKALTECGIA